MSVDVFMKREGNEVGPCIKSTGLYLSVDWHVKECINNTTNRLCVFLHMVIALLVRVLLINQTFICLSSITTWVSIQMPYEVN